jgi:serine/threonine protein kinase
MSAAPEVNRLLPGDPQEIDEYRVLSRLGTGGQGVVYLAVAPSGDRVAIKRLLSLFGDEKSRGQFAKEVSAARRVAPFCTAQVVDARLDGDMPYVVSEYIDGLSLEEQVRDYGPVTGVALQRLAIGTTTALTAIHAAGLVHRDLKPANVMLAADGPRVIDFGIARDLSMETTVNSGVVGTLTFMAPEQLRGERVGPSADLFAWASVIVYAATGRTLFDAPDVVAVIYGIAAGEPDLTGVPADLLPVVRRCLSKDPKERPSAQQALVELLGRPGAAEVSDPTGVLAEAAELVLTTGHRPQRGHRTNDWAEHWAMAKTRIRTWWQSIRGLLAAAAEKGVGAWVMGATAVVLLVLVAAWSSGLFSSSTADVPPSNTENKAQASPPGPTAAKISSSAVPSRTKDQIQAKYRGSWVGPYQLQGSEDQTQTAQIHSGESKDTLVISFAALGCKATLHYMNSSAEYLHLAAEISSDLTGACGKQATVTLKLTTAEELLMTWDDLTTTGKRITAVLHRT